MHDYVLFRHIILIHLTHQKLLVRYGKFPSTLFPIESQKSLTHPALEIYFINTLLARLYPKLGTRLSLSGKTLAFWQILFPCH